MSFVLIPGANEPMELNLPSAGTLPAANKIVVSIVSGTARLDKTGSDLTVSGSTITVAFTQADTLKFNGCKKAKIQVNWLDSTIRYPTYVGWIDIDEQLYPVVMS